MIEISYLPVLITASADWAFLSLPPFFCISSFYSGCWFSRGAAGYQLWETAA